MKKIILGGLIVILCLIFFSGGFLAQFYIDKYISDNQIDPTNNVISEIEGRISAISDTEILISTINLTNNNKTEVPIAITSNTPVFVTNFDGTITHDPFAKLIKNDVISVNINRTPIGKFEAQSITIIPEIINI